MEVSQMISRCPFCDAVINPRWDECIACGENLAAEPVLAEVLCLFCGQVVERGTPDTGALGGGDLHMDCYRMKYPIGHFLPVDLDVDRSRDGDP